MDYLHHGQTYEAVLRNSNSGAVRVAETQEDSRAPWQREVVALHVAYDFRPEAMEEHHDVGEQHHEAVREDEVEAATRLLAGFSLDERETESAAVKDAVQVEGDKDENDLINKLTNLDLADNKEPTDWGLDFDAVPTSEEIVFGWGPFY